MPAGRSRGFAAHGGDRVAGRAAAAHLDLKEPGCAGAAVGYAVEKLGTAGLIVTTRDARLAAAVNGCFPAVPVALTVGDDIAEAASEALRRLRRPWLTRLDRVLGTPADWAAVHHRLARAGLLAECRRRGIKTVVWTVNSDQALARWLASPAVDVVVTGRPARAMAVRDGRVQAPPRRDHDLRYGGEA
jgi:glycerophosphoryl diester phosphodiesterase